MLATYSFALLLWGVLNHKRADSYFFPEKADTGDWLNFAQFTVAWLGQLVLYGSRPAGCTGTPDQWTDLTDSANTSDFTTS